jgi:hypothetical protein
VVTDNLGVSRNLDLFLVIVILVFFFNLASLIVKLKKHLIPKMYLCNRPGLSFDSQRTCSLLFFPFVHRLSLLLRPGGGSKEETWRNLRSQW